MRQLLWMRQNRLFNDPVTETVVETHTVETTGDELESTDDVVEDIDELAEQLAVHQIISEERHEEILQGVAECQKTLETLSGVQTENPILTTIMNQLIEMREELIILRLSLDMKPILHEPNELILEPTLLESDTERTEQSTDEAPEDSIENPPETQPRKNRFI